MLIHHTARCIVAVGGLRASGVLVCHHPARGVRGIVKAAHLHSAPVIHRRQLAARGIVIAHQRGCRQVVGVFRVVRQPDGTEADPDILAVAGDGQCVHLLQHQPEATACAIGHPGDMAAERPGDITVI